MANIYDLFIAQYEKAKDSPALIYKQHVISYRTLFWNAEKIACLLREQDVKCGDVVGLYLKRSPCFFSAILAILKLGAAYMPLDRLRPMNELCRMMDECRSGLILTDQELEKPLADYAYINLPAFDYDTDIKPAACLVAEDYSQNLAYIIYTSGSTGKAKGVGIRQESLMNLILHGTEEIGLKEKQRIIFLSNYAFDMSVPETIMPMCRGMSVVIADEDSISNPRIIRKLIQNHEVSTLSITPTRMHFLLYYRGGLDFLQSVRYILFGAEKISDTLLRTLRENCGARIFNLYGPTETTAYLTYSDITDKDVTDIGNAIQNTALFLVDSQQEIMHGEGEGEIVIGGIGVANGYICKIPERSGAFRIAPQISDTLVFFTGDYAKRLKSGELLYKGRYDNQIKYRGYRLGAEEIENTVLSRYNGIALCAVSVAEENDEQYLVLVYTGYSTVDMSDFKKTMGAYLPLYSIPDRLLRVAHLPFNKNGKIDRKAVSELLERGG